MQTEGDDFTTFVKAWTIQGSEESPKEKHTDGLFRAAAHCDADIMNSLLSEGVDVNVKDNHERTALMHATWEGRTEIVRLLLSNGADVNSKDRHGRTSLLLATENGDINIVRTLLEKGADVDAQDEDGMAGSG